MGIAGTGAAAGIAIGGFEWNVCLKSLNNDEICHDSMTTVIKSEKKFIIISVGVSLGESVILM